MKKALFRGRKLKIGSGLPVAVSPVEAEQCADEGEDNGANRSAAEGDRIHAMVSIDGVIEIDSIEEEDASGEQESEGQAIKQSAQLAFEDAASDAKDEAGELERESDDETRDQTKFVLFAAEHRGEYARSVVIEILGIIEGIREENENGNHGHKGYAKTQQYIDFTIHKFTYRRVIYATYKKGTRRFSLPWKRV